MMSLWEGWIKDTTIGLNSSDSWPSNIASEVQQKMAGNAAIVKSPTQAVGPWSGLLAVA
jgi:hypothetical protein